MEFFEGNGDAEMAERSGRNVEVLLKFAFWLGAVTDGLAIIPMLSPKIGSMLFGGDLSQLSPAYRYAMGIGASLMAGWTVLLLWGSARPVERRAILIFTVFPVITGIIAATVYGVVNHLILLPRVLPLWVHLGMVSALYVAGFLLSLKLRPVKYR